MIRERRPQSPCAELINAVDPRSCDLPDRWALATEGQRSGEVDRDPLRDPLETHRAAVDREIQCDAGAERSEHEAEEGKAIVPEEARKGGTQIDHIRGADPFGAQVARGDRTGEKPLGIKEIAAPDDTGIIERGAIEAGRGERTELFELACESVSDAQRGHHVTPGPMTPSIRPTVARLVI